MKGEDLVSYFSERSLVTFVWSTTIVEFFSSLGSTAKQIKEGKSANDEEAGQRRSSQAIPTSILRQWLVVDGHCTFQRFTKKIVVWPWLG